MSRERLRELAQQMAVHMGVEREKPHLHVVGAEPAPDTKAAGLDAVTRESHIRMIRSLRRYYAAFGMGLIVDQATLGVAGIEDLDDVALVQLHRDIDRARECIADGVTFEEAGLLRSLG